MREARYGPLVAIRVAIVATAIALVLSLFLLYKETPYVFTAFMILGPALLGLAMLLLGVTILRDLKQKGIL